MIVFLDGQFLPADQALVSIFDRSFLYGDGLFETVPLFHGRPFRWQAHWERLTRGAEFLGIEMPYSLDTATQALDHLGARNSMPRALARVSLSRGAGPRGYSTVGARSPRMAISLHELPEELERDLPRWSVITSSQVVVVENSVTAFKTANKLGAVLARREADTAEADDALVLNSGGRVAEASAANLFWIANDRVLTPPLSEGALNGVTRAVVRELCEGAKLILEEQPVTVSELRQAQGIFLTLSTWGVVEVARLDGHALPSSPYVRQLWEAYWALVNCRI